MNSMGHQGYTARIEYDERDHIFVGRILGNQWVAEVIERAVTADA